MTQAKVACCIISPRTPGFLSLGSVSDKLIRTVTLPDFKFLSLDVNGHANAALPNRFLKQIGESRALAVLLPGLNYSCDNPLLYYTTNICIAHSIDVLQLWANYNAAEFQSLSEPDQLHWLVGDAAALIAAGRAQRSYTRLILVGKSIGTLTLGALLGDTDAYQDPHAIWFTPLIRFPVVVRGMLRSSKNSLFLAGSADRSFNTNLLGNTRHFLFHQHLIIDGADHSLQIPGDLSRSLDVMKQIVATIETFINSVLAE